MLYTLLSFLLAIFLVSLLLESIAVGGVGGLLLLIVLVLLLMGRI